MSALVQTIDERVAGDNLRDAVLAAANARLDAYSRAELAISRDAFFAAVAASENETVGTADDAKRD